MNSSPIGIFDSGVGGLTVFKEIIHRLPHEDIIYLGDTAHMPYGNKSTESIIRYTIDGTKILLDRNIKLLVIACHTASSHALQALSAAISIPIINVIEPGFDLLMKTTKTGRVAILATEATIRSGVYQQMITNTYPQTAIFPIACPLFAPLIEEGLIDHLSTRLIAEHYLAPLQTAKIDAALLACTHYPLIRPLIQEIVGQDTILIEPAEKCAEQVQAQLSALSLLNWQITPPKYQFYATDCIEKFDRIRKIFIPSLFLPTIT